MVAQMRWTDGEWWKLGPPRSSCRSLVGVAVRALADGVDRLGLTHGGVLIEMRRADIMVRAAERQTQAVLSIEVLGELKWNLDMKARDYRALVPVADGRIGRHIDIFPWGL